MSVLAKIGLVANNVLLIAVILVQTLVCNLEFCTPGSVPENITASRQPVAPCHAQQTGEQDQRQPEPESQSGCRSLEMVESTQVAIQLLFTPVNLPFWQQLTATPDMASGIEKFTLNLLALPPPPSAKNLLVLKQSFQV